ncbi:hypothetical protein [Deinococcus pimensis]|uniref:hypothetical protein n=1 Tax=Deinococcus pimensis TaxID=309888 RepID=UPI0004AE9633|nr:hypothetical protein [Deinococcus pimensis]
MPDTVPPTTYQSLVQYCRTGVFDGTVGGEGADIVTDMDTGAATITLRSGPGDGSRIVYGGATNDARFELTPGYRHWMREHVDACSTLP